MIADAYFGPRTLKSASVISARKALLNNLHILALEQYVSNLAKKYEDWEIPHFDPLDGGVNAEIIFLFEKPGPKTSELGGGSGFISRDNNDPTAEATFFFMEKAGIQRERTIIWNLVPGWNGTRKLTSVEIRNGIEDLSGLLALLPRLKTIVLVGEKAKKAIPLLRKYGLRILASGHPSPLVRASRLNIWNAIPLIWAQALD